MHKTEILERIEQIATSANDEQVKLNALSYLLNRIEIKEKELEIKQEDKKYKQKAKERFESLVRAFE